jgi:hypothetical protein
MSKNSDVSNISRRRFLAAAGTVAAANSLVAGKAVSTERNTAQPVPPPSPDSYLVTITVRNGSFSYEYSKNNGPSVQMPNKSLTVNRHDQVEWQASVEGSHRHHGKVRFTGGSPFNNNEFKWTENHKGGGPITTSILDEYYYCVGIHDDDVGDVHPDDPKIIVGGRGPEAQLHQAESELRAVQDKIKSVIGLLEKAGKDIKKDGKDSSS